MTVAITDWLNLDHDSRFLVFEKCPMSLIQGRRVCNEWNRACDEILERTWKSLKNHPPEFPFEISAVLILRIAEEENEAVHKQHNIKPVIIRFKALNDLFKSHGVFPKENPLIFHYQFQKIVIKYIATQQQINEIVVNTKTECTNDAIEIRINHRTFFNLTFLDLSSLGLEVIPSQLNRIKTLEKLHLHKNKLTSVPPFTFPELITLSLFKNRLRSVPNFKLDKLQFLSLYSNRLSTIPDFNFPQLKILSLQKNNLSHLPSLTHLTSLQFLRIQDSHFLSIHPETIDRFYEHPSIQLYQSQLEYECKTPLSKLYQQILRQADREAIEPNFLSLETEDRKLIYRKLCLEYDPMEKPHCNWAKQHLFTDMNKFYAAAYKATHKKLFELRVNCKNKNILEVIDQLEIK